MNATNRKKTAARLRVLNAKFQEALDELNTAAQSLEEEIDALVDERMSAKVDAANGLREELTNILADLDGEVELYIEDKSEQWQGGDTGQAWADLLERADSAAQELAYEVNLNPAFTIDEADFDVVSTVADVVSALEEL